MVLPIIFLVVDCGLFFCPRLGSLLLPSLRAPVISIGFLLFSCSSAYNVVTFS